MIKCKKCNLPLHPSRSIQTLGLYEDQETDLYTTMNRVGFKDPKNHEVQVIDKNDPCYKFDWKDRDLIKLAFEEEGWNVVSSFEELGWMRYNCSHKVYKIKCCVNVCVGNDHQEIAVENKFSEKPGALV